MLGRPNPGPGEGLLLEPCQAVHMYWMRYPLDIAFLDEQGEVVAVYHELQPSRMTRRHGNAAKALEMRAGTLKRSSTEVGDTIELERLDN